MRNLALAAVVALSTFGAGTAVQAMPALQIGSVESGLVQVSGGCGPGAHRVPSGRCIANYYGRPEHRFCPPGLHRNRFGRCRPNF